MRLLAIFAVHSVNFSVDAFSLLFHLAAQATHERPRRRGADASRGVRGADHRHLRERGRGRGRPSRVSRRRGRPRAHQARDRPPASEGHRRRQDAAGRAGRRRRRSVPVYRRGADGGGFVAAPDVFARARVHITRPQHHLRRGHKRYPARPQQHLCGGRRPTRVRHRPPTRPVAQPQAGCPGRCSLSHGGGPGRRRPPSRPRAPSVACALADGRPVRPRA